MEIGIGLVKLHGGELGVMLGIHALVAENAAYFINALDATHDKAFQGQLGGDTHIHIYIEGVMVGDKGSGGGSASEGAENGGLHLHIVPVIQIGAQEADKAGAYLEISAAGVGHDKINVALAVLKLHIGHAVEFFGQGAQARGEQSDLLGMHGYFPGLGLENKAGNADDVAYVILAEIRELLLGNGVLFDVKLYLSPVILDMAEDGLAHAALGHDASGHGNGLVLQLVEAVLYLGGICAAFKLGYLKGVAALVLESLELIPANLQYLGKFLLSLLRPGIYYFFGHICSLSLSGNGSYLEAYFTIGHLNGDDLAHLVTQQGLADGGFLGEHTVHGISLLGADYLILLAVALPAVLYLHNGDGGAVRYLIGIVVILNDLGVLKNILYLGYL